MSSRIERTPIEIPDAIKLEVQGNRYVFSNGKDSLSFEVSEDVQVTQKGHELYFGGKNIALAGTTKAIMKNHILGLQSGFEKKLKLVGVGYKCSVQGKVVTLNLGYSNPVKFDIPEDLTITAPSQTQLVVSGIDKQRVGQVSAEIRALRPPEPYKGKGVRYEDEVIILKEVAK